MGTHKVLLVPITIKSTTLRAGENLANLPLQQHRLPQVLS